MCIRDSVSGLHCEPETVKEEMQATKELWGKTDGRTYKYYVQSYHEDEEITSEQAHKNAVELAEHTKAWKGHEVRIATHIDKGHIHTHFIVNSVNYEDGHKLQWSKYDLKDLKERCNEQSREQGLHVPVSYTHLDVYKRQCMCRRKERPLLEKSGKKRWHGAKTPTSF